MKLHGVLGLFVMAAAAVLLVLKVRLVMVFLTPIVWTAYILAVDAAVFSLRGCSLLVNDRIGFAWMALLSIPLWLIFEAYNLRLQNGTYVGLPKNTALRCFGYLWSFATIGPGILETADLLLCSRSGDRGRELGIGSRALPLLGASMVLVPLLASRAWGAYLFGLVWMGFAVDSRPSRSKFSRCTYT